MNLFQIRQFVIRNIDGNGEEQARISPVNEFVGIVFNEVVGILRVTCHVKSQVGEIRLKCECAFSAPTTGSSSSSSSRFSSSLGGGGGGGWFMRARWSMVYGVRLWLFEVYVRRAVKKIARDLSESKFAKIRVAKARS
jgi:hypothetical protein